MAERNFAIQQYTLEKQVVTLYATLIGQGASAPLVLSAQRSKGFGLTIPTAVLAVTRSAVGTFTLQLSDPYNALLSFQLGWNTVTGSTPACNAVNCISSAAGVPPVVGLNASNLPTPIPFRTYAGTTLTDPALNDVGYLVIELSNSGAF